MSKEGQEPGEAASVLSQRDRAASNHRMEPRTAASASERVSGPTTQPFRRRRQNIEYRIRNDEYRRKVKNPARQPASYLSETERPAITVWSRARWPCAAPCDLAVGRRQRAEYRMSQIPTISCRWTALGRQLRSRLAGTSGRPARPLLEPSQTRVGPAPSWLHQPPWRPPADTVGVLRDCPS